MKLARAVPVLLFAIAGAACAPRTQEPVRIADARSMSTPPGAVVGVAYMTLLSRDADVLLGAETPVAGHVEMHVSEHRDGMMTMRPLPEVELSANGRFEFAPTGAHFMLVDLHGPLEAGTSFPLTLRFKTAGNVTASVSVLSPGDMPQH